MGNIPNQPYVQKLQVLKARGIIDVETIAELLDCSERYVRKILSEPDKDFKAYEILLISNYLSDRGINTVAKCFHSSEYNLMPRSENAAANGVIDDEVADMVEALGHIRERFNKRCPQSMREALENAHEILARVDAEMQRL